MRADEHALRAVDADRGIPDGELFGEVAPLEMRGAGREDAPGVEGGDRQLVAAAREEHLQLARRVVVQRERRNTVQRPWLDLLQGGEGGVDRGEVAPHDLLALAVIALLDRVLDRRGRLLGGQHARKREEARLQDAVHAARQAGFAGDPFRVDDIELELLARDLLLHGPRQATPGVRAVGAGEQEGRAGSRLLEHVNALEQAELMARDEVRLLDQVRRLDRVVAEAQMGDGHGARLLRVVDEVGLDVAVALAGDDLRRVLVRADRAVGAEPVEEALRVTPRDPPGGVVREAGSRDVVLDADGEVAVGADVAVAVHRLAVVALGVGELAEDGAGHRRGELLRAEPVAAADHGARQPPLLVERGDDVLVERLADRRRVLRPVEHRDRSRRERHGGRESDGWRTAGRAAP